MNRLPGFRPGCEGEVMHAEVSLDGDAVWLHGVARDHGPGEVAGLGSSRGTLNRFVPDVDERHARPMAAVALERSGRAGPTGIRHRKPEHRQQHTGDRGCDEGQTEVG